MPWKPPHLTEDLNSGKLLKPRGAGPPHGGGLTLVFERGFACGIQPFRLDQLDSITLGRSRNGERLHVSESGHEKQLTIGVEDSHASSRHAHLSHTSNRWHVEDVGSKNGTFVNGQKVDRWSLRSGDVIELGRSCFVYSEDAPYPHSWRAGDPELATFQPSLARQFERLAAIAHSNLSVVIQGETGTGKELAARATHQLSGRKGPFRAINCGALPRALTESELFGYRKGAFSGASEDRTGLVRSAHEGTLFLDEIGDLPLEAQASLLRVLQEGEVLPLGATKAISVDVRVVAASHCDLDAMAQQGRFRPDLLARLLGFKLVLPPLRQRREDFGLIIQYLIRKQAGGAETATSFTTDAIHKLFAYPWPANIRELEKTLASALVFAAGRPIELEHLPSVVVREPEVKVPPHFDGPRDRHEIGRAEIEQLLAHHKGNVSAVAVDLCTSRMQVHRLCKRFGINISGYRSCH
jgi:transcriptional regulator of acetoin/glycerol metabolism